MKKFINKKSFTLLAILIICTSIFTNSSQAAQVPHYHDGMNFNDEFLADPGFGDVYPPNYYYEDIWRVEVDGIVMGNMGF